MRWPRWPLTDRSIRLIRILCYAVDTSFDTNQSIIIYFVKWSYVFNPCDMCQTAPGPALLNIRSGPAVRRLLTTSIIDVKFLLTYDYCTPNTGHDELLSCNIRHVDLSGPTVQIKEHFLGFCHVNDTSGKGLADTLIAFLDDMGLDLCNCKGQGYNKNGSNMKGCKQGVQARIFYRKNRELFMCHVARIAWTWYWVTLLKAVHWQCLFRSVCIPYLYVYHICFVHKALEVIRKHLPSLTLKTLCETRWESRIASVKPVRFQTSAVRDALFELAENCDDSKTTSEAHSLITHELETFEFH